MHGNDFVSPVMAGAPAVQAEPVDVLARYPAFAA